MSLLTDALNEIAGTESQKVPGNGNKEPTGSQANGIKAYLFLQQILIVYEGGLCDYREKKWNDSTVARHLDVPSSTVANIRRNHFGDLKRAKARYAAKSATSKRLDVLEQEVGALKRLVRDLSLSNHNV
jgi:hypothetical protein